MNQSLPTLAEIEALHRKYAPHEEAFQSVYVHCQIVAETADELITVRQIAVDRDLVRVGCLLHDIGVYALYKGGVINDAEYIRHGVLGEEILASEGFPPHICRYCSHHTGVGLTRISIEERHLPLPHQDFLAETPEEELIMYADKFHSKSEPPVFNSAEFYTEYVGRFGAENSEKFTQMVAQYGVPDLERLSKKYQNGIRTKIAQ